MYFDPSHTDADRVKALKEEATVGPIAKWSFSALQKYETCPLWLYTTRVRKIKEPSSEAATRGNRIHDLAEEYVTGQITTLPAELIKFESKFEELKALYNEGKVECEEDWGYDIDWKPTESWRADDTWAMLKLDAFVREDETSARVIDYKTGKKFGNELKHGQQGLTYTIGAFARYPELQSVQYEFWYLDKGETLKKRLTRNQIEVLEPRFTKRALSLTQATVFPPNPSKNNCRWCPHKDNGECDYGEK